MEPIYQTKPSSFMTNIPVKFANLIQEAANETGYLVFTREHATTRDGDDLPRYVEVHTIDTRDHTPFWNKFEELRAEFKEAKC